MSRKSRLLGIVSHAMLIQEPINSNKYFWNKIHSLPEFTTDTTFTSIITPYIAFESDNICNKPSFMLISQLKYIYYTRVNASNLEITSSIVPQIVFLLL